MQINLQPDLSLLAIMAIFIANYLVVRRFFVKPVNDILESRERERHEAHHLFEGALAKFNEATANVEERLHVAKKEASAVRESLRNEAVTHRKSTLDQTRSEAERILADADAKLTSEVATARKRIVADADALARMAAERILGRAV